MDSVNNLHRLLNVCHDPHTKLDEDAVIDEIRRNPDAPLLKYDFRDEWVDNCYFCHPLHQAIIMGASINVVEAIYNCYPPALKETFRGSTSLCLAIKCIRSSSEVIEFVLKKWPGSIKVKDTNKETPLHRACHNRPSRELVDLLLRSWPSALKEKDGCGSTPLLTACNEGASANVLSVLLEGWPGAAKEKGNDNNTPLHNICSNGGLEEVTLILQSWPDAVWEKDSFGRTALHYACLYGKTVEVIFLLLEKWPEATRVEDKDGFAPIDYANFYDTGEVISKVLSYTSILCSDDLDNASLIHTIAYFIEIEWYKGVSMVLHRHPSIFQGLNIDNKVLPQVLHMLGYHCKLTTLWHVISNKQDILADL